ncbi:MAG: FixH family protein [Saprospiraceae bacterium]|jgi:nitrogen fixation protein FixH
MKFNWPIGLVAFFILFIGSLVFVVYQSTKVHDSLVVENYYEEDINYQSMYDKKQNVALLAVKAKAEHDKANQQIKVTFPVDSVSGTSGHILLYNPYSAESDVKYDINIGKDAVYLIDTKDIKPGRWKLKMDWKQGDKEYYQEEEVIF